MDKLYTVQEFADLLRVHKNTILKMIKNDRIHPINVGSKNRPRYSIPQDELYRLRAESFENNKEE